MIQFDVGDLIALPVTFTNLAGAPTDPTTLVFLVQRWVPIGALQTFTYGTDAAVIRDSAGAFHLEILPDTTGTYIWRAVGTGAVQQAVEGSFAVTSYFDSAPPVPVPAAGVYLTGITSADGSALISTPAPGVRDIQIVGGGGGSGGPPAYTWQEVETADVTLDGTITATSVRPGGADRTVRLPVITADNSGLVQIVTFSGVSEGHTITVRGQGDDWVDNGLAATVVLRHVGDAVAVIAHYVDSFGDNFWRIVTPPNAGLQIEWVYPSGAGSILNARLLLFYGDRIENPATGQVTVYLPVALGPHTIGTSPVPLAHGLGYTPVQVDCNLTGPGQIWQSTPADGTNIYLQADAAGRTANVFVR